MALDVEVASIKATTDIMAIAFRLLRRVAGRRWRRTVQGSSEAKQAIRRTHQSYSRARSARRRRSSTSRDSTDDLDGERATPEPGRSDARPSSTRPRRPADHFGGRAKSGARHRPRRTRESHTETPPGHGETLGERSALGKNSGGTRTGARNDVVVARTTASRTSYSATARSSSRYRARTGRVSCATSSAGYFAATHQLDFRGRRHAPMHGSGLDLRRAQQAAARTLRRRTEARGGWAPEAKKALVAAREVRAVPHRAASAYQLARDQDGVYVL